MTKRNKRFLLLAGTFLLLLIICGIAYAGIQVSLKYQIDGWQGLPAKEQPARIHQLEHSLLWQMAVVQILFGVFTVCLLSLPLIWAYCKKTSA